MKKGFLIYEEMRKYFPMYEEAVSHISEFPYTVYEENLISFYQCTVDSAGNLSVKENERTFELEHE
jgi:hypothetical protein